LTRQLLSRYILAPIALLSLAVLVSCDSKPKPAEQAAPAATATSPAQTSSSPATTAPAQAAPVNAEPAATSKPAEKSNASAPPVTPVAPPASQSVAGLPDVDPHKTRGSKSAPIVMETFSDFQCPACKQLFLTTTRPLTDNYISTGKVFAIHRDFPLPGHAYSRIAARYGRAASQLGKLEQVEQVLFQNQEKWEQTGDVDGTVASAFTPAEMNKIRALANSPAIDAAIEKDIALGKNYGVNQTPTTVIHYKGQTYPVAGVVTYDVLRSFLDQLLSSR
jgi:protein-disulfide isomerase